MKLREVMSSRVFPVRMDAFIDDAVTSMSAHHVTAAPVTDDDGHLVGLVTASHLQLAWLEHNIHPVRAFFAPIWRRSPLTVGDVMRTPVASLTAGADITQAAEIFADRTVECILIVDGFTVSGIMWRDTLPS